MKFEMKNMRESETKTVRLVHLQFFFLGGDVLWMSLVVNFSATTCRQEAASVKALQDHNLVLREMTWHGLKFGVLQTKRPQEWSYGGFQFGWGFFNIVLKGFFCCLSRSTGGGFLTNTRRRPTSRAWSSSLPSWSWRDDSSAEPVVIPTRRSSWCLRRKNGRQTTSRWVLLESRKNQVANTTQQHGTKCRSCKQPCDMKMKQSIAFSFERDLTCREKHRHKCCSHISCIPLCQVGPVSDDQVFEDLKYQAYVHAFPVQTSDASNFCIFFQLLAN